MEFTPPQLINFRLIICSLKKCASNANKKPTLMTMMMSSTNQQHPPIPAPRTPKGRQVARSNLESVSCEKEQQMGRPNKNDLSRLERILMKSRNEDLNLAALISAVEKDIWYMEQLEQNPSVLRRKNRYSEVNL